MSEDNNISDDDLKVVMISLLEESDLTTATLKSLMNSLEGHLQISISHKKEFLAGILGDFIDKKTKELSQEEDNGWHSSDDEDDRGKSLFQGDSDGDDDNEGEAEDDNSSNSNNHDDNEDNKTTKKSDKPRKNTAFSKELQLSTELSEFMNATTAARTDVVKYIWKYIKENNLQNPKDKREILCDESLEKIFKRKKVTMFSMNKYLAPMMKDIEALQDGHTTVTKDNPKTRVTKTAKIKAEAIEEAKQSAKDIQKKRKRPTENDSKGNKKAKNSGFQKPLPLSPQLAAVIGVDRESRGQVVSKLWAYIKENNLQSPKDKRVIIPDDKLKALFKVNSLKMFEMSKLLVKHIYSDDGPKKTEKKGTKSEEESEDEEEDEEDD